MIAKNRCGGLGAYPIESRIVVREGDVDQVHTKAKYMTELVEIRQKLTLTNCLQTRFGFTARADIFL